MKEIAIALLTLPDKRIVFQRRGETAPVSPNLLGFFGGHVETGEAFEVAIRRELAEETSLNIDQLRLVHIADYVIPIKDGEMVSYHLYKAGISDLGFEVYEGIGAEAYSKEDALARDDLTPSAKHVLNNIVGDK